MKKHNPGTYAHAQAVLHSTLLANGWIGSTGLKFQWADSPDRSVRLYFKARSIYVTDGGCSLNGAHSLWLDPKQLFALLDSGAIDGRRLETYLYQTALQIKG